MYPAKRFTSILYNDNTGKRWKNTTSAAVPYKMFLAALYVCHETRVIARGWFR